MIRERKTMVILRNKEFSFFSFGKSSSSKTSFAEIKDATSDEIKESIIYKLFPTIDPEVTDYVDSEKLKKFKSFGLKDRKSLINSIENSIWKYEKKKASNSTGVTEKDIKGNIDIFAIYKIIDNETIVLSTEAKKGSSLDKKLPDFYWDVEINLRTGISDVAGAGD